MDVFAEPGYIAMGVLLRSLKTASLFTIVPWGF